MSWILPNFTSPPAVLAVLTLAPFERNSLTASRLQLLAAQDSGVKPPSSATSAPTPLASSSLTLSILSALAAVISAMSPCLALWRRGNGPLAGTVTAAPAGNEIGRGH